MNSKCLSLNQALRLGNKLLTENSIENSSLDARILLQKVSGFNHEELISKFDEEISMEQFNLYKDLIYRRINFEPISQIVGKKEFYGREFNVNKHVLTPRADSETIIEACLELYLNKSKPLKILDLGVGSGCLLFTLLAEFPNSTGIGVDISPEALEIAKSNSENLMLTSRARLILNNWADGIEEKFDIIVCNPPYIKNGDLSILDKDVSLYEPYQALFGGNDGLECYQKIAPYISKLLNPSGFAIFECGQFQHNDITDIFIKNNLNIYTYKNDLSGIVRCIIINLI
ncbi:MAG: peptide chain release factor N(5)-glutamine methyltransferase [Alphaproteobacteria bacterium]